MSLWSNSPKGALKHRARKFVTKNAQNLITGCETKLIIGHKAKHNHFRWCGNVGANSGGHMHDGNVANDLQADTCNVMDDFIIKSRIWVRYTDKSKEIVVLKGVIITGNKTLIGQDTKVMIPEGVTTIEERAFYGYVHLTEESYLKVLNTLGNVSLGFA